VRRNWKIAAEGASVLGFLLSALHYGPALVSFMAKANGWTIVLILTLGFLCIGGGLEFRDYLNRRFATTDQSLRETVAEESKTIDHRISQETARLDAALKCEIDNRVGGDQMDRARIGQLEARVGQLENQNRRLARSARPVAQVKIARQESASPS
jgi:hypothetical protein